MRKPSCRMDPASYYLPCPRAGCSKAHTHKYAMTTSRHHASEIRISHESGNCSQAQRRSWLALTVGSSRGSSTKQPPAQPMKPGKSAGTKNKVVPHAAQNEFATRPAVP